MSHPVRSIIRAGARAALGIASVALLAAVAACGSGSTASSPAGSGTTATPSAPTPTTAPAGPKVLFQNSLALPPDSGWIDDPSFGCFFAGGGYHIKDTAHCGIPNGSFQDQTSLVQDADVTVQVKQVGGATGVGYGIGLGNPVQLDRFDIESDGKWAFLACQGSHCTTDVALSASPAIHTGLGASNTLQVRVQVTHFDFYVNGTKVGQADDANYSSISGQIALDGSDGIEVVFNNLKIATAS
jgi:hypothetical protein